MHKMKPLWGETPQTRKKVSPWIFDWKLYQSWRKEVRKELVHDTHHCESKLTSNALAQQKKRIYDLCI